MLVSLILTHILTLQIVTVCPGRFTDSNANLICKVLGYEKSVDWFGISASNTLNMLSYNMSSPYMVLKEMSCLPGANDLNDCTYDFSKNLDVCARVELVRYASGKITATENENVHVVTICNPKPGQYINHCLFGSWWVYSDFWSVYLLTFL